MLFYIFIVGYKTDVIQKMIEAGEPVSPVWFNGDYINITYVEDIERAENIIRRNAGESLGGRSE